MYKLFFVRSRLLGKELPARLTLCFLCIMSFCNFSYFPFCFEGRIWVLIAPVPGHCLLVVDLLNGSTGQWFRTTVQNAFSRSSTLFNIFLAKLMGEPLEDHKASVNIGGRIIISYSPMALLLTLKRKKKFMTL